MALSLPRNACPIGRRSLGLAVLVFSSVLVMVAAAKRRTTKPTTAAPPPDGVIALDDVRLIQRIDRRLRGE